MLNLKTPVGVEVLRNLQPRAHPRLADITARAQNLDLMVSKARLHGWIDSATGDIRAHVERH